MGIIFGLLFLVSLIMVPVVVIRPQILEKALKRDFTRTKAGLLMLATSFGLLILSGSTLPPSTSENATQDTQSEPVVETSMVEETKSPDEFLVTRIIDGDTIEIEGGRHVRYIGIDTPETVEPGTPTQCFGIEASNKNKELVEGKTVRLEKDVSETDRYGRLLRYVYVGDIFVNDFLVREGYANASSYPPDIKYQEQLTQAETEAREADRGLWSSCMAPETPPQQQTTTITPVVTQPTQETQTQSKYACNCSKTCPNMSSCEEAQYQLNTCGCSARDADDDGIACDAQCQ